MTDTATVDTAGGPAISNRMKVAAALVVAVVVLTLGGWAAWAAVADKAADQIEAGWTVDCANTKVGSYEGEPAIHSRAGWRCGIELTITNGGDRSVQVKRVESPILGPGGGAEIRALSTDDAELDSSGTDGLGAVWKVDLTIPGGESRTITLGVGWRRNGCNSAGRLWLEDWPTIEFETLRRTYKYSPEQRLVLRTFDEPRDAEACPNS